MNLRTTFILVLLAAGVGSLVWQREWVARKLGSVPSVETTTAENAVTLLPNVTADRITQVTIRVPGSTPLELAAKAPGQPLELPGNWPVRRNEVAELLATLTNLKSRFQAVPLSTPEVTENLGLTTTNNRAPITAELTTVNSENQQQSHRLTFGRPEAAADANPFLLPVYVRVNDDMVAYNVGQEILGVLNRPLDFYRKRQVFPETERLKIAENPRDAASAQPTFILNDQVKSISVQGPNGGYTLERVAPTPRPQPPIDKPTGDATLSAVALAESWVMVSPVTDRVDPVKLKNLLATIPDLWVDQFIINPDPLISLGAFNPFAFGANPGDAFARFAGGVVESQYFGNAGPFLDLTGLKKPAMTLTLTLADGSSRSLLIGKVSRTNKRTEAAPPPMFPGQPPSPPKVIEEPVYFAKLPNTPLVFEIRGEKLGDVFFLQPKPEGPKTEPVAVAYAQLRDGNVVRFDTEQVKNVAIKTANQTLQLRKTKGDPKADSDAGRKDQWEVLAPFTGLAEAKQITDLLDPIDRLSAKPTEVIDRPALHAVVGSLGVIDLQAAGLTAEQGTMIEITSEVKTNTPVRQLIIGKHDAASKKMLAWSPATPNRISIVDDAAKTLIERHPRAYRSLKLFNLTDHRVESIQVTGGTGNFNLKEVIGTKKTYTLTEPVTVETDTDQSAKLLTDLAAMDISEFVYDPPTEAERNAIRAILGNTGDLLLNNATAAFGVDQPALSVTLNFAGSNPIAAKKLHIGKLRPGKPEYYARLEGSASVFTLKKEVPDVLLAGSLALLPTQLWNGSSDGLTVVEVTRGKDAPYTLKQTGSEWKLTAPYEAPLDVPAVIPMATAISAVKAERYAAHVPKTLAEYGLDQPALRVKFTLTERLVNKPGDNPKEITKERVLLIGKTDDAKGGRFAKLDGDSNTAVFVLNDKAFNDIDKPALELLNKKLLSLNPAAVTKLELTGPDGPITLEKQGADWKPVGAVFPVDKPTVEQIARYLTNLSVIKFAEYGPNIKLAPYGLDPAAKPITLKVSLGMETHTVEIGKVAEGTPNDRYVRVDNGNAIGILAVTTARDLSKSKLELADRTVFKFDPIDLQAIRRTMKGQELELVLETANWSITKPNKFPADQQTAEELADRLGALRADRIADIEGKDLPKFGLDQPEAILKIEMLGKGAKTIEKTLKIGKPVDPTKPDGERFAQADGASTVLVLSSFIAKKFLAEPLKFRERNLANFITADRATVTRGGKAITFEKVGGAWKLKPPTVGDIEEEALRELLDTLAKFRADEIVAEKPTDLKPYGLDNPDRWQWFNGDKEVLNLLVGGSEKVNNTATMRAYAKLEKSDLVVLLDMALSTKLRAEYRKRALWEPLDVATASAIIIDTVEGPGSFKLIKGPAGWIDPANPKDKIDTALVTEFLDAFAGLKADRYLETDPKEGTKIFGLDPAQKTITVSTQGNQSRTILLGRIDKQKRVYAQVQGKKEVSVLTPADTTKINRDRASFSTEKPEPKKVEEKKPEEKKPEPKKVEEKKPEEKKTEPKKAEEKK